MELISFALQVFSIALLLLSGVFLLGIIWRTEMKLDKSYKLFFAALLFLIISEISSLIFAGNPILEIVKNISKVIFTAFFLGGILEARSMFRELDGEKDERQEQK